MKNVHVYDTIMKPNVHVIMYPAQPYWRYINMFYFYFFQLFGGGIFGFCLWVLLDFFINQYVQASDELKTVLVIVHVIIVVGVALLIFGIIGIYGAARPRRWALITVIIN